MQINNLPASNSFSSTDVLPIEINGVTYKVTGATLAAALQTLGNYLTPDNVANNLTTTAAGSVLDARQGKVLNDKINATQSGLAIIVDGDTASMAVPVGGYAYIKNNTHGLAEGLYTNTSSGAFPASGGTADGTVFTVVGGGGLNDIKQSLTTVVEISNNAGFHNSIYRGKYLGDHVTAEQWAAISAGTFDGLYVGDYWTINGVDWVIVGFDIRYNIGDTPLATHHIGVMPRVSLNDSQWYTSNDTSHGYVGSTVRANIKGSGGAQSKFIAAFGNDHVLSFREIYPSAYSSGNATGWAWVDARTELLSEVDVYGCPVWSVGGKGYEVGADKSQLPIFRLRPDFANIRAAWWLRSVGSASHACFVSDYGHANYSLASASFRVLPLSLIG